MVLGNHIEMRLRLRVEILSACLGILSGGATAFIVPYLVGPYGFDVKTQVPFLVIAGLSGIAWFAGFRVALNRVARQFVSKGEGPKAVAAAVDSAFLSFISALMGFSLGPFAAALTVILLFNDDALGGYSFLEVRSVLTLICGIALAAIGYSLRRRPALAAAFAGASGTLYAAPWTAEIIVQHWPVSGSDEESALFRALSIVFAMLWSIVLVGGGYWAGRVVRSRTAAARGH